jgi:hypothetical protein
MFDESDPYVQFKLSFLKHAMPAKSAVVFGDIYVVDGGYTKKCLDYGCNDVLLIDTLETAAFQLTRIAHPKIEFYKGDFSNPGFMRSFDQRYEVGVAYEVLLHQAPLLHTLHLMLEKVSGKFCIVQPMLKEQAIPNALIYLPGNTLPGLYPLPRPSAEFTLFDVNAVNHSRWLWGMTVSFMKSVLLGEGFEITFENEVTESGFTEHWRLWGCVAERKSDNPLHWSHAQPSAGLHHAAWQ